MDSFSSAYVRPALACAQRSPELFQGALDAVLLGRAELALAAPDNQRRCCTQQEQRDRDRSYDPHVSALRRRGDGG